MTATYDCIATTTLSTATASVTFSSISGSYTDLVLVSANTHNTAAGNQLIRINGDTGTNYSRTRLTGNGTTVTSGRRGSADGDTFMFMGDTGNPSNPNISIFHFMNYANTTTNKTILGRNGANDVQVHALVGLWRSTSAITTILIYPESGNYASGSTFSLFGIKAE